MDAQLKGLLKHLHKMILAIGKIVCLIAINSNVYSGELAKALEEYEKLSKKPIME